MFLSRYETFPGGENGKTAEQRPHVGPLQQLRRLLRKLCPCWPLDILPLKRYKKKNLAVRMFLLFMVGAVKLGVKFFIQYIFLGKDEIYSS